MSDTDSFIDEVTEELRRDQLYKNLRKYGWIAVLLVLLVVGGAAFSEYRKAQARSQAQAMGDALFAALDADTSEGRAAALSGIDPTSPEAAAVLGLLEAAEQADAGNVDAAVASLDAVAVVAEAPEMYRRIAQFKSLTLQAETLPAADRRIGFEALAQPGSPLRMLAEEQLALISLAEGDTDAAIAAFQSILTDAEVTADLQQRALQVMVALGGEPDLGARGASGSTTGDGN